MKIISKKFYNFLTLSPLLSCGIPYLFLSIFFIFLKDDWGSIAYKVDTSTELRAFQLHNIHIVFFAIILLLIFAACIPWIVVTIVSWKQKLFSKKFLTASIIAYCLFSVLYFLVWRFDPYGLRDWYIFPLEGNMTPE